MWIAVLPSQSWHVACGMWRAAWRAACCLLTLHASQWPAEQNKSATASHAQVRPSIGSGKTATIAALLLLLLLLLRVNRISTHAFAPPFPFHTPFFLNERFTHSVCGL